MKSLASYPDFCPSAGPAGSSLKHEATILSLMGRHPNIIEFYGLSRQGGSGGDERVHIVTKLEAGGSIEQALGVRGRVRGNCVGRGGRAASASFGSECIERGYRGLDINTRVRATWAEDVARG